jgi:outer membrane protein assembly factor BamE (lipoprotein component of BamABCDE complex)
MKPRRRKLLVALAAATVAGLMMLAGWVCPSQSHPRINRSSFTKIRPGMTLEEVEALLGAPAGSQSASVVPFDAGIYVAEAKRRLPAAAACRYES